jgi:multiple sugar transport system substrate-binding protein
MKLLSFLLATLLLFIPASLIFAGGEQEAAKAAEEGPIQLRILWWGGQSRHDKTLKVIDMFQEKNPNIKIEPEYLGWSGYFDRLAVLSAAEDVPDIFQITIERIPQYNQRGLLADLSKIPGFNAEQIAASARKAGDVNGRLLAAVLGTNAYCLAYNPEMLDKVGVAYPTVDWTWKDFRAAAVKIRDGLKVYGVNGFGSDNEFEFWIRSRGAKVYGDKKPGWDDDGMVVDFFKQIIDYQGSGISPPAEYSAEVQSNEENSLYAQGQAGMMFLWSNKVVSVRKTLGKDSGLMVLPGPGNKQGMYLRPSMFFSVAQPSTKKPAAAKFINYFLGDVEANLVLNADRGVPVVGEVLKALAAGADSQNKIIFDYIALVTDHSSPIDTNFPETQGELDDVLANITQQVSFRKVLPEEGAEKLRTEWTAVMSR